MSADLQSIIKRKQRLFDSRTIFFLLVVVAIFISLTLLILKSTGNQHILSSSWTPEKQFQYANMLAAKGLKREALNAYDRYMEMMNATPEDRAKVAYQMGSIYMELGEYEKALASFYRIDIETPDSELSSEIGQKIVACLELLGMTSQARHELESRTAIKKKPNGEKGDPGPVIARIGKEEIRLNTIYEALDQLPPWMRKQYESDEGKVEFVRQYIATELLYRKAMRLGHENDPDIRVKIRDLTKQVLVQKIIMDEIGKIIVDPRDVEMYYNAYKDRYAEKAKFKLSLIQAATREKAEEILRRIKSDKSFADLARSESKHEETKSSGGAIKNWVARGGYITDVIGNSPQAWEAIDKVSQGATSIVEVNKQFYIFWVHERTPERQRSFSEVKDQVETDYRQERQEQAAQDLLNRTLEEQEVEIYTDKLLKGNT